MWRCFIKQALPQWHKRTCAGLLVLSLTFSPVHLTNAQINSAQINSAPTNLPSLGDSSSEELSPAAERRLGEQIVADARRQRAIFDDPELTEYLNQLGATLSTSNNALASNSSRIEFFVVQDPAVNAFALPGGFIGVNTGLLATAQTESELAAVLAHEVGHVSQRHVARMMSEQKLTTPAVLGALLLGILVARSGTSSSGDLSQAAIAGAQAAAIQKQLNFSRDAEREADRIGLQSLVNAGFEPQGMPDFLQRLQQASRLYENNMPGYLSTHPLTVERIADIQNRVRQAGYKQHVDSVDFQLARMRALNLQENSADVFEKTVLPTEPTQRAAWYYGQAISAFNAAKMGAAQQALVQAKQLVTHPWLEKLSIEIEGQRKNFSAALAQARSAYARWPQSRSLRLTLAQAWQQNNDHKAAVTYLREQIALHPRDAALFELLAASYAALGDDARQHLALAEKYQLEGWSGAALEQLEMAQRYTRGSGGSPEEFMLVSEINARLRQLREQLQEQNKQRKPL